MNKNGKHHLRLGETQGSMISRVVYLDDKIIGVFYPEIGDSLLCDIRHFDLTPRLDDEAVESAD